MNQLRCIHRSWSVDGLLHITDISWDVSIIQKKCYSLTRRFQIVVLDFDDDKKRISLGMKQLTAHPWDSLAASLEVGSRSKR